MDSLPPAQRKDPSSWLWAMRSMFLFNLSLLVGSAMAEEAMNCHLLTAHTAARGWKQAAPPGRASPAHPGLQAGLQLHVGALKISPCVFISRTALQHSPSCTGFVPTWQKVEISLNNAVKLLKEFNLAYFRHGNDYRKIILSALELFSNVSSLVCIEAQTPWSCRKSEC